MLPSVLAARDKWLKPDGVMTPHTARIMVCPFTDPTPVSDATGFWTRFCKDNYGIDTSALLPWALQTIERDVLTQILSPETMLASPGPVVTINTRYALRSDVVDVAGSFDFGAHYAAPLSGL
jgi:hypothetical protein